tara:strand:+ start:207 stop:929 length:723 start_codon:yes stop_codon:yes gene_type:complete
MLRPEDDTKIISPNKIRGRTQNKIINSQESQRKKHEESAAAQRLKMEEKIQQQKEIDENFYSNLRGSASSNGRPGFNLDFDEKDSVLNHDVFAKKNPPVATTLARKKTPTSSKIPKRRKAPARKPNEFDETPIRPSSAGPGQKGFQTAMERAMAQDELWQKEHPEIEDNDKTKVKVKRSQSSRRQISKFTVNSNSNGNMAPMVEQKVSEASRERSEQQLLTISGTAKENPTTVRSAPIKQ